MFVSSSNRLSVMFHSGDWPARGRRQGFMLSYRAKIPVTTAPGPTGVPGLQGRGRSISENIPDSLVYATGRLSSFS